MKYKTVDDKVHYGTWNPNAVSRHTAPCNDTPDQRSILGFLHLDSERSRLRDGRTHPACHVISPPFTWVFADIPSAHAISSAGTSQSSGGWMLPSYVDPRRRSTAL